MAIAYDGMEGVRALWTVGNDRHTLFQLLIWTLLVHASTHASSLLKINRSAATDIVRKDRLRGDDARAWRDKYNDRVEPQLECIW